MQTMETCGVPDKNPDKKPEIVKLLQTLETQVNTVIKHQVNINRKLFGDIPVEGNTYKPATSVSESLNLLLCKLFELERAQWAAMYTLDDKLGSGTPL